MSSLNPKGRLWKVAIYIRLSREDAKALGESESVANQRILLRQHLAKLDDGHSYRLVGEYVDDGVSGTTDEERDGFQRMLSDIRRGLVNCVIVKDLARSFRNYSDQGYYLDDWFPRHNVRFISLFHQPLDSFLEPRGLRNIAVPIQGVLNENHCAETSDKVREVLDSKRRNGQHIGSFALYGYQKDPHNKNALVVDPEAAQVVRDIYRMFLTGMGIQAIVRALNQEGVDCPSVYKRERLGLRYQNPHAGPDSHALWCAGTVREILKNRMYCGDMVQGRYRIKSYKVHLQEHVPEDQWFVVENTHPPIVDRAAFQQAQRLLKRNTRSSPREKSIPLFSGLLYCADCGKSMVRSQVKGHVYYYCRTYKQQSKEACSKHTLRHDPLEQAVLIAIQRQMALGVDVPHLLQRLDSLPAGVQHGKTPDQLLCKKQQELEKVLRYQRLAYQDWKDDVLPEDQYRRFMQSYLRQKDELEKQICELMDSPSSVVASPSHPLADALRQQGTVTHLTRELLLQLIDRIEVDEKETIKIFFRFCHCDPVSTGDP